MPYVNPFTQQKTPVAKPSGYVNPFTVKKTPVKADLTSLEGLENYAQQSGTTIPSTTPKISILQRLGKGLGAFNPAEAVLTGMEEGIGKGLLEYPKRIAQGIGSAITGTDYDKDRRMFKDVAEKAGIQNGIAKFGIGFIGDVLLDPTTYFGGAIVKGLGVATKGIAGTALRGIGKIAPETEAGLKLAGTGIQDALGKAFQYGYKASKGAREDVLTYMSKGSKAKLGLASSNLNRLGTGILTKSQREELALKMVAGKRAEFTAREAGKTLDEAGQIAREVATSSDPVVQKTITEQLARSQKMGAGITDNPYEVYFPFIKSDKVTKFLNETKGIKVGSEGYRKQFKNLLTNENLELDPAKAFFTRESQIVADKMTRGFLGNFVKKYGKGLDEFENSDEAAKAGYQLIREKGIFGKELGYVGEFDAKLIRDSISPEFQTINMLAKATGFDAVTSLFKRSVTGLFAPFHVRNFVSGNIQNFEVLGIDAFNPKNIAIGQKIAYLMARGKKIPSKTLEIGGKSMKFSEVMKPFTDRFSGDTFYNADFDAALKNGGELRQLTSAFSKDALKKTIGFQKGNIVPIVGLDATLVKIGRAIGQFIEHQQKATAYVTALSQGKKINEALRLAEAAGFDYRALTRFESQIMRRIVPFYSFTRKNVELQLKTLGENPQRINQVLSFFGNIGTEITDEERAALPEFIRESIGIRLQDTPEGLKQYISTFGTPIEAFTQLFGNNQVLRTISMANPILKVPVELGFGKDSFRKRDLKDVYTANEYKMAPQVIKDLLEIKEVEKPIYQKDKDGKSKVVGQKTQYVANPERLLIARSLFTTRGVSYLDQVFGDDLQGFIKFLKTTTGVKPQQIDIEQQKYFQERDKMRELEDKLIREGNLKEFNKTYIPKD